MDIRYLTLAAIAVLTAAAPTSLASDSYSFDIELGYQWVDVTGNEEMYASQVDREDGFVLGDLSILSLKPDGAVYDRMRLNASGFGGDPSGRLSFDLGLGDIYNLTLLYLTAEHTSVLPAHANPFADEGVVPGQHTFHRNQDMLHLQLELLPGRVITPILGYRWNRIEGPRQTTYHVGQDEFQLRSELEETEREYYVGLAFNSGDWRGVLTQGWRNFDSEETLELDDEHGSGNNLLDVLGVDVNLDSFHRQTTTKADTPVTNFSVNGRINDRLELRATYVRADAEAETSSSEMLSGSLVSYRINRFFGGLDDSIASQTESPSWRGELDLSFDFSELVTMDLGFGTRKRSLDGWAMVSTMYLDTLSFSGMDASDVQTLSQIRTSSERDETTLNIRLSMGGSNPVGFWVSAAVTDQTMTLDEDMAQIIVPLGQEGTYAREIQHIGLGAVVKFGDSRVTIDWQNEDADEIVMRTDFTSRSRLRMRAQFPIGDKVDLYGTAELITADNLGSGVRYQARTEHLSIDLAFTPIEQLSFVLTWDDYTTESSIGIRIPHDFSVEQSLFVDDGGLIEGRLELDLDNVEISAGYTKLENDGTLEFGLDRFFARVSVDVCTSAVLIFEIENHHYEEDVFTAANFDSSRYAILVRIHR